MKIPQELAWLLVLTSHVPIIQNRGKHTAGTSKPLSGKRISEMEIEG